MSNRASRNGFAPLRAIPRLSFFRIRPRISTLQPTESPTVAKGKLVLVPFPFDDASATKVRPSLCLTDEIGLYRHVVLAFLTSQTPSDAQPTDLLLSPAHADFALTGLRGPGTVR